MYLDCLLPQNAVCWFRTSFLNVLVKKKETDLFTNYTAGSEAIFSNLCHFPVRFVQVLSLVYGSVTFIFNFMQMMLYT